MWSSIPNLDDRRWGDLVEEALSLIPLYCPEWTDAGPSDPGRVLVELYAAMLEQVLFRLNRLPEKNHLTLLALLGLKRLPAQAATTPLVFETSASGTSVIPAGTPVSTQGGEPVIFETVEDLEVSPSRLISLVSSDYGRFQIHRRLEGLAEQVEETAQGRDSGPGSGREPRPGKMTRARVRTGTGAPASSARAAQVLFAGEDEYPRSLVLEDPRLKSPAFGVALEIMLKPAPGSPSAAGSLVVETLDEEGWRPLPFQLGSRAHTLQILERQEIQKLRLSPQPGESAAELRLESLQLRLAPIRSGARAQLRPPSSSQALNLSPSPNYKAPLQASAPPFPQQPPPPSGTPPTHTFVAKGPYLLPVEAGRPITWFSSEEAHASALYLSHPQLFSLAPARLHLEVTPDPHQPQGERQPLSVGRDLLDLGPKSEKSSPDPGSDGGAGADAPQRASQGSKNSGDKGSALEVDPEGNPGSASGSSTNNGPSDRALYSFESFERQSQHSENVSRAGTGPAGWETPSARRQQETRAPNFAVFTSPARGPVLLWEFWDGSSWQEIGRSGNKSASLERHTQGPYRFWDSSCGLRQRGQLSFDLPASLPSLEQGGVLAPWLRARVLWGESSSSFEGVQKHRTRTPFLDADKESRSLKGEQTASLEEGTFDSRPSSGPTLPSEPAPRSAEQEQLGTSPLPGAASNPNSNSTAQPSWKQRSTSEEHFPTLAGLTLHLSSPFSPPQKLLWTHEGGSQELCLASNGAVLGNLQEEVAGFENQEASAREYPLSSDFDSSKPGISGGTISSTTRSKSVAWRTQELSTQADSRSESGLSRGAAHTPPPLEDQEDPGLGDGQEELNKALRKLSKWRHFVRDSISEGDSENGLVKALELGSEMGLKIGSKMASELGLEFDSGQKAVLAAEKNSANPSKLYPASPHRIERPSSDQPGASELGDDSSLAPLHLGGKALSAGGLSGVFETSESMELVKKPSHPVFAPFAPTHAHRALYFGLDRVPRGARLSFYLEVDEQEGLDSSPIRRGVLRRGEELREAGFGLHPPRAHRTPEGSPAREPFTKYPSKQPACAILNSQPSGSEDPALRSRSQEFAPSSAKAAPTWVDSSNGFGLIKASSPSQTAPQTPVKSELIFEGWFADGWKALRAEDRSQAFTQSGILQIQLPSAQLVERELFGQNALWLRARLLPSADWRPPILRGIWLNAVEAMEGETLRFDFDSSGDPELVLSLPPEHSLLSIVRVESRSKPQTRTRPRSFAADMWGPKLRESGALSELPVDLDPELPFSSSLVFPEDSATSPSSPAWDPGATQGDGEAKLLGWHESTLVEQPRPGAPLEGSLVDSAPEGVGETICFATFGPGSQAVQGSHSKYRPGPGMDEEPGVAPPDALSAPSFPGQSKAGDGARWTEVDALYHSGPEDLHFTADLVSGEVRFGDGKRGAIPRAGARSVSVWARVGGGEKGNLPAGSLSLLLRSIKQIRRVSQPLASSGGCEAESIRELRQRSTWSLRSQDRAVTRGDFEVLARQASQQVARAHCLNSEDGQIEVVIVPRLPAANGLYRASPSLLKQINTYLDSRRPITLRVKSSPATFIPLLIELLLETEPGVNWQVLVAKLRGNLNRWLHPLQGGSKGEGWPLGRAIAHHEILSRLESMAGIEGLRRLSITSPRLQAQNSSGSTRHRLELPKNGLPHLLAVEIHRV